MTSEGEKIKQAVFLFDIKDGLDCAPPSSAHDEVEFNISFHRERHKYPSVKALQTRKQKWRWCKLVVPLNA